MFIISSFRSRENKLDVYIVKDCMKKFCESLREHTLKTINFKKKKMKLLTKEQQKSYENAHIYYICKQKFENKYLKDKKYSKVRDHCHYTGKYKGAAHSICNLKYSVPKKNSYSFSQWIKLWLSFYYKTANRRIYKTIYLFRRKY